MAVGHVERVIDIERDACGRRLVALQPEIDQDVAEPDDGAQVRQVLGPRQRRLGTQVRSSAGQAPAGELEGRIATQPVEIIGVLIAAGDRENPRPHYIRQAVRDAVRIARIKDHRGKPVGQLQAPLGCSQQHDPAIRGDPAAVERGRDLLACNGWK